MWVVRAVMPSPLVRQVFPAQGQGYGREPLRVADDWAAPYLVERLAPPLARELGRVPELLALSVCLPRSASPPRQRQDDHD